MGMLDVVGTLGMKLLILQFILAIQGVESNHGRNINHRTIANETSMHFGDAAIGPWAVMPKTVLSLKKDLFKFKTNPIYQKQVVKLYALYILRAAKGCPLTASILWLRGPNGRPTPLDYTTPRYRRFIAEWQAFSGYSIDKDPSILRYCQ